MWQWANEEEVSKLLGTPFGLSLKSMQVDSFLVEKIEQKLKYWVKNKINSIERAVVCNGILISATVYFLSIWGGTL
jgi:hypothetical protein